MADECIHGFDDGLCAICFPPPEPEAPAPVARSTSRTTVRGGPRVTARQAARVPGRARTSLTDVPPVDVRTIRIYHVTHLDNLVGILGAGALLADVGDPGAQPAVDVAAPAVREFRRSTALGDDERPIAAHVPFYLSTDALLWDAMRRGEDDPRLAGEHRPGEFAIFVSTVAQAAGDQYGQPGALAVADADPALPGSTVVTDPTDVDRLIRRLVIDDEGAGLPAAELLAGDDVPLDRVALIAVGNDRVRDRVRDALAMAGVRTRVAVYPPWFQPGGGAEG